MANIQLNPRKTKPSWLQFPCSICDQWEQDESALDPQRKALWNNKSMPDSFRCKFHPLLCDVDYADKCPYKHLLGKTIIGLYCDMCGKEYEYLKPTDPRLEEYIKNPFHVDICPDCQKKKDKDLQQKRVINVLSNSDKVKEELKKSLSTEKEESKSKIIVAK